MMKSAKALSALMLMGIFLSACLPAAAIVTDAPAAIAMTSVDTATPAVTATLTTPARPTTTLIPTVTKNAVPVEDPTPATEIRVIQNDLPGKYLPTIADCQPQDGYYIRENGYSPEPNQEILNDMGALPGRKYIADTARITGWKVEYLNSTNQNKPGRVVAEAVMHERPQGAQKALLRYNPIALDPESGWQDFDGEFQTGDNQEAYIRKEHIGTDVEFWHIQVEFTYYNYWMKILVEGKPSQMDLSFLQYLVNVSHKRLEEEQLFALQPEPTPAPPDSKELQTTVQPQDLALLPGDLPKEGGYRSSKYDVKTNQNIEIIRQWGVDIGRKYVIGTDRKLGWSASYSSYERRHYLDEVDQAFDKWWEANYEFWRNRDPDYQPFTLPYIYRPKKYPDFIDCQVVQYGSTEGARKALSMTEEKQHSSRNGWRIVQGYETVGDTSVITINHYVVEGGDVYGDLSLSFVYRNYLATVVLTGFEQTIDPTFAMDLSNIILEKMKKADSPS